MDIQELIQAVIDALGPKGLGMEKRGVRRSHDIWWFSRTRRERVEGVWLWVGLDFPSRDFVQLRLGVSLTDKRPAIFTTVPAKGVQEFREKLEAEVKKLLAPFSSRKLHL